MDAGLQQCALPTRDPTSAAFEAQRHVERVRVNELLRYFEPAHHVTNTDGGGKPRIATDTSLTAYAQLAALKLNCQRAFISLIDDATQYIVAEASRTIGLESEDVYDGEDDKLSFGQTVLDFKTGVCPGTIACFSALDNSLDLSTAYVKASRSYYVMNDMSQLDGYKFRPYVNAWPYMRYYAEVPIHSPAGYTIGTLCVVDNEPRDGLDLKGLSILKEIGNTIMNHLELCVSKIQRNRAERMVQALGQFIQGEDSIRELWIEEEASRLSEPGLRQLTIEERAEMQFGRPSVMQSDSTSGTNVAALEVAGHATDPIRVLFQTNLQSEISSVARKEGSDHPAPSRTSSDGTFSTSTISMKSSSQRTSLSRPSDPSDSPESDTTTSIGRKFSDVSVPEIRRLEPAALDMQIKDTLESVFFRAANLIREAVDLEGTVFFDPRRSNGQLVTDPPTNQLLPSTQNSRDTAYDLGFSQSGSNTPLAKVLACSTRKSHDSTLIEMKEALLHTILHHLPSGGLLNFDAHGIFRAIPFGDSSIHRIISVQEAGLPFGATSHDSITADIQTVLDVDDVKRVFAGVSSLMIYPIWDANQDKCITHCMAWSSNPARTFQRQDVTYLASFSNSVLAQLARMEAVAADQAKTAFISSISHELRSPLHGIMASMEILRDSISDKSHHDVINLVESCGSALLDTIDNVLAFSQSSKSVNGRQLNGQAQPAFGREGTSPAINLGKLVEDVTSVCLVGVEYSRTIENPNALTKLTANSMDKRLSSSTGPIVICDIPASCCELIQTDRAIWKRILMNLVGNAVKYTTAGYIIVKYEENTMQHAAAEATDSGITIKLTVKDSGKGMSKDYQTHHLFKPFYQENALAPGMGLGLSIVSRLVQSIGGKIDVVSEINVGTEISITATLKTAASGATKIENVLKSPAGLTLGFFGLDSLPDLEETPTGILSSSSEAALTLRSVIAELASSSGLDTTTVESIESNTYDILVVDESRYRDLPSSQITALRKPIIMLCSGLIPDRDIKSEDLKNVVLFARPFGPRNFDGCIESCAAIRNDLPSPTADKALPLRVDPFLQRQANAPESPVIKSANLPESKSIAADEGNKKPVITVLLVEDNPINLKLLVACVAKLGFNYLVATNGAEAVDAYVAHGGKIAVIFMDIQMPVMNGMESTKRIRQHELTHSLSRSRIIALTALGTAEAKQVALDSGADMFLTKPVSLKMLTSMLVQYGEGRVES